MQLSEKTLQGWRQLRDKGDNQKLADLLDMAEESISAILRGKQETTSDNLIKIKAFFEEKKKVRASIEK